MAVMDARAKLARAARQEQFLEVVSRDEAEARFRRHLRLVPLGRESIPLARSLGRVLAADVIASVDVPGFDRSAVDGFALRAADAAGASAESPRTLRLNPEMLTPGVVPIGSVAAGTATLIATGGMLPAAPTRWSWWSAPSPGRRAARCCSTSSSPWRPGSTSPLRAAISPGARPCLGPGRCSPRARSARSPPSGSPRCRSGAGRASPSSRPATRSSPPATRRGPAGCSTRTAPSWPRRWRSWAGSRSPSASSRTTRQSLSRRLAEALVFDVVLLSGGTSKGAGDVAFRVVSRLGDPGIVVHGVALKPGKPHLPGRDRRKAGRRPARVSHLRDLHLPRVRGPRDPRLRRHPARAPRVGLRHGCPCGSPRSGAGPST